MLTHNINPIALSLGPLQIHWYGIIYMLGFVIGYIFLRIAAQKNWIKGFNKDHAETLIVYLLIGVIVGARFFEVVVYNLPFYLSNPELILQIWKGGLSFHGALVGSMIATWIFIKKNKLSFYEIADVMVMPTAIALGLGRIANFVNAELVGTITNVSWCVNFPTAEGCRHPVVLYESLKNFFTAGVVSLVYKYREHFPKGTSFWTFVIMYGILRTTITFLRDEPRYLGMTIGQYLSIGMIIVGGIMLYLLFKRKT